jgi:D-alanyl-lipoteichoic acid acyltransferase DltB (MBOAT superfamily)
MIFSSEPYLVFLPVAVAVNWLLPAWLRPLWLVAASYFFYAAWNPPFLFLIAGLTIGNYFIGMWQGKRQERSQGGGRLLLAAAIALDLGALCVFKYLGLLDETAQRFAHVLGLPANIPGVNIFLPLGLSFFTFEFIHYQVDIFKGGKPIRNPINFALFPAFFPTQIAGPIKRYQDFNPQVESRPRFDPVMAMEGVELIALGLFKKIVLADNLSGVVGTVFGAPGAASATDAFIGILGFTLQVYFDFSGYTDIGRGSAQLLGYRVPLNFRAPFLATSIQDFWRRWHITLSFWLRDYVYFALGGNRTSKWRSRLNLVITMALGGLWHGAAWHFLLWGVGWGVATNADHLIREQVKPKLRWPPLAITLAGWALTQLTFMLLMLQFRASFSGGIILGKKLLTGGFSPHLLPAGEVALVPLVMVALLGTQLALRRWNPRAAIAARAFSIVLRPAYVLMLGVVFSSFLNGATTTAKFIYFQF